jgi:hypothetical protein
MVAFVGIFAVDDRRYSLSLILSSFPCYSHRSPLFTWLDSFLNIYLFIYLAISQMSISIHRFCVRQNVHFSELISSSNNKVSTMKVFRTLTVEWECSSDHHSFHILPEQNSAWWCVTIPLERMKFPDYPQTFTIMMLTIRCQFSGLSGILELEFNSRNDEAIDFTHGFEILLASKQRSSAFPISPNPRRWDTNER